MKQTRITLAKVKYFAAGSEETSCFVADILFDGRLAGRAQNEGRGGPTNIDYIFNPDGGNRSEQRRTLDEAGAFAKSLPDTVYDDADLRDSDGKPMVIKSDIEHVVDNLLIDYLVDMDLKKSFNRNIKKKVMFIKAGKVWLTGVKATLTAEVLEKVIPIIKARNGEDIVILNTMDRDAAYAAYKAAA